MTKTRRSFLTLASSSVLALALGAGPVFAGSWGSSGGGSSGGGFLRHHGGGSSGGGFLRHHGGGGSSGGGSSGGGSLGGFLHHGSGVGPAAAGSCTTSVAAAPAAVDRAADCCITAAADPVADPTDIPRLPLLARRNGWTLPVGARRPTQAGEEGWTRPSRQFLAFSVPAGGRICRAARGM